MEILIHLGAHKTATTYVQRGLLSSVAALGENGVFIVPTVEFRHALKDILSKSDFLNRIAVVRRWRTSRLYQRYLRQAEIACSHRLVISEEGLLGSIHGLTNRRAFYEFAQIEKGLRTPIRNVKGRPVTAILVVRSYDSFFTSAWCQTVKELGYRKFDEIHKSRLMSLSRGWFEIVSDLFKTLPHGSKFRVLRFEDFIKNETSIFSELVGEKNLSRIALPAKKLLPGLSKEAVDRLDNLHLKGEPTPRAVVLAFSKEFPKEKGFDAFAPWNEEEKHLLVTRYENDIARIRAEWPDIMVH